MKRWMTVLLALCLTVLVGCGEDRTESDSAAEQPGVTEEQPAPPAPAETAGTAQEPQEPQEPEQTELVYDFDGVEIPVPREYETALYIESEPEAWNEHWTPLISFSSAASVEAYRRDVPDGDPTGEEGIGWICTVMQLDRVGFEDWLSGERGGTTVFAADDADRYYLISRPTDVRMYEPDEMWTALNEWSLTLPRAIIDRNGLAAYDAKELFAADYTYPGKHVDLGYRFPGQPMDLIVLSLSQPVKRGEGGVWCVERVRYVYSDYSFTDTQLVYPVSFGADEPAADYYRRVQAECDAGEHPELLSAAGAALDYARRAAWIFGEDVSEGDFEPIEAVG